MPIDRRTIQNAARADRITWRYHALQRAIERGITRAQAKQVLLEGDILEHQPDALPYPKCLMMQIMEDGRPLYVALGHDQDEDHIYVITVHWLDPAKWDDPWTRRR